MFDIEHKRARSLFRRRRANYSDPCGSIAAYGSSPLETRHMDHDHESARAPAPPKTFDRWFIGVLVVIGLFVVYGVMRVAGAG